MIHEEFLSPTVELPSLVWKRRIQLATSELLCDIAGTQLKQPLRAKLTRRESRSRPSRCYHRDARGVESGVGNATRIGRQSAIGLVGQFCAVAALIVVTSVPAFAAQPHKNNGRLETIPTGYDICSQ